MCSRFPRRASTATDTEAEAAGTNSGTGTAGTFDLTGLRGVKKGRRGLRIVVFDAVAEAKGEENGAAGGKEENWLAISGRAATVLRGLRCARRGCNAVVVVKMTVGL